MKKYIPILVVLVLVLSTIWITRGNPVWASPKSAAGLDAPLKTMMTLTSDGTYNIGGVCQIEVVFKTDDNQIIADAEVLIAESKLVPFSGDSRLLFPGCHFVFNKANRIVSPMSTNDATLKVCFGASPELKMGIYYYLDTPGSGGRVWAPLPTTMEDNGRLICAPALYTGVYMPTGKVVPPVGAENPGANPFFPNGSGGSVRPPASEVSFNKSGTYAVGGVCLITAKYLVKGLSDTVQVEYPTKHYTEDTKTVPFDSFYVNGDLFYFPGCHVVHYRDEEINNVTAPVIQDQMNKADPHDGDWQICFAAIPGKTMTIYYYDDNLTKVTAPWTALATTTQNGMACAGLVDFSAVYAPAGK